MKEGEIASRPVRVTPISAECELLLAFVRELCPGLLPVAPIPAGTVAPAIDINTDQAVRLFPAAAAIAAGIDPFSTGPALALVKWQEGDRDAGDLPVESHRAIRERRHRRHDPGLHRSNRRRRRLRLVRRRQSETAGRPRGDDERAADRAGGDRRLLEQAAHRVRVARRARGRRDPRDSGPTGR